MMRPEGLAPAAEPERDEDRDAEEELGYIFQPDWWPPSP